MRQYLYSSALLGDLLAIVLAYLVASLIRFGQPFHAQAFLLLGVILPIYLVTALNHRCYAFNSVVEPRAGIPRVLAAFTITLGVVSLVAFFLKVSEDFSRATLGIGALVALLLLPAIRYALGIISRRSFGDTPVNNVVIEDGVHIPAMPGALMLDAQRDDLFPRLDDPAMLDRLGRTLQSADRVIVACPPERRSMWANALRGVDVNAEILAPELDVIGSIGVDTYHGRHTLIVAAAPLNVIDQALKRLLDLTLVICSLPVTLPVMAAVAVAIRLDSPGPILFAQERVGLGNRLFRMYKFRSMYVDRLDSSGEQSTQREDNRVTRVGKFIRASSLDEFPQLFNVLSGAMSIVGPRPHALGSQAEDLFFWDIDPAYWHRHAVKPGLTGLAQVRGYRGATERTEDLRNRLQADLEYLVGWTIWRDLKIIFATFRVLVHRNAY